MIKYFHFMTHYEIFICNILYIILFHIASIQSIPNLQIYSLTN